MRGGVWDKALRYGRQAGAKAMERSASREAVGCYEQALAALEHLPEHRTLREQAIDLRLDLFSARLGLGQLERILHDMRVAETLAWIPTIP
jgi:predicted ATPase